MLVLLLIAIIIIAGLALAWMTPAAPHYPPREDRDHDLRRRWRGGD